MRKPAALNGHPITFEVALACQCYRGVVDSVYDGDTIHALLDKGHFQYPFLPLRLRDVRCAEVDGKDREVGRAAKAFLEELAPVGTYLLTRTYKASFDRFVADVWLYRPDSSGLWVNPGFLLYLAGHSPTYSDTALPDSIPDTFVP